MVQDALIMSEASELPAAAPAGRKKGCGCWLKSVLVAFFVIILCGIVFGPTTGSIRKAQTLASVVYASEIAQGMEEYSANHNGQYPTGKSSTDVFQKLIDEGYINDPTLFCWRTPRGESVMVVPISASNKLKSEEVCYDLTVPVDANSPDHLPIVFLTGYKVTYSPGGSAVPIFSSTKDRRRSMVAIYKNKIMAVFYRNYWSASADYYIPGPYSFAYPQEGMMGGKVLSDGTISNFIPIDFDAKGKTYVQLTPKGPLSP